MAPTRSFWTSLTQQGKVHLFQRATLTSLLVCGFSCAVRFSLQRITLRCGQHGCDSATASCSSTALQTAPHLMSVQRLCAFPASTVVCLFVIAILGAGVLL